MLGIACYDRVGLINTLNLKWQVISLIKNVVLF